ncbi:MAG: helix-turn-helix domain-containing protein [Verrucomicrobiota bacterium]
MNQATTLGERIRQLRLEKKLSMRALALKAGIKSVAFIADIEKGYRKPAPENLERLAQALETPLEGLRELDDRAPVSEIRRLVEENPEWAMAFRKMVKEAQSSNLTPRGLVEMIKVRVEEGES